MAGVGLQSWVQHIAFEIISAVKMYFVFVFDCRNDRGEKSLIMSWGASDSDYTALTFCSPLFVDFFDIGVLVNVADFYSEGLGFIGIGTGALQDMVSDELVVFEHFVDNADGFLVSGLHVLVLDSLLKQIDMFFDHFRQAGKVFWTNEDGPPVDLLFRIWPIVFEPVEH